MPLNQDELLRYRRHLTLPGFGQKAQEALKASSVLVIGAGGLGCPALLYLAAAGVGRIGIIDSDKVEFSNLQRQVLFQTTDVGLPKAETAARRLQAINPLIRIETFVERFSRANALELLKNYQLVIDGTDNFATRYLVNDACVLAHRPLVYGAIQGFEGQVSVFNVDGGPTYRCLFPEPPEPGTVPTCSENGVLGVLPGLIGTLQATEAIKLLAGIGEPLVGRLLMIDALTMRTTTLTLEADPKSRDISELPPEGYGDTCVINEPTPEEVSVEDLEESLRSTNPPQLIDVREPWERALGRIDPSVHAPLGNLERGDLTGLELLNPDKPTVVYCAHGMRSLRGMRILRDRHGFTHVSSLRGGEAAWSDAH